jgi:hypothetical protein
MRRAVLALVALLVAACTSVGQSSSATTEAPVATINSSPSSSAPSGEDDQSSGRLPDGRQYELELDPELGEKQPTGVDATIEINMELAPFTGDEIGCPTCYQPVLGITTFVRESHQEPSYSNGLFRASSGDWTMHIAVYPDIVKAWGPDIEEALVEHVRPVELRTGLPAFQLSGALAWTEDVDVPAFMHVVYPAFAVRRGCDETGVACSSTKSVQVVPLQPEAWDSGWTVRIVDVE